MAKALGLGAFTVRADPTAGLPGGAPITYPDYPCQIRYLSDGTVQSNGTLARSGIAGTPSCSLVGSWVNYDMSKPFNGLKKYVDGIEMYYNAVGGAGFGAVPIGWNLTNAGKAEYARRVGLMKAAPPIYAPLPPGVDGAIKQIKPETALDAATMRYSIALEAATQSGPDKRWRYYDPVDWSGHSVLPGGFFDPADGGKATFASGDALDFIQKEKGVAGDEWYWLLFEHPETGQLKVYLTQHISEPGGIFSKLGKNSTLAISIVGAILGVVTLGIATAAAAVIVAGIKAGQAKEAADQAVDQQEHDAEVQKAQADYQESQAAQQLDEFYAQNKVMFLAAGYDESRWRGLSIQDKTTLIQLASNGRLAPAPETVAAAEAVQREIDAAEQRAAAVAGTGAVATQSAGSVWMMLGIGVLGLIMSGGSKKSRR
jgi:hypothetical protein